MRTRFPSLSWSSSFGPRGIIILFLRLFKPSLFSCLRTSSGKSTPEGQSAVFFLLSFEETGNVPRKTFKSLSAFVLCSAGVFRLPFVFLSFFLLLLFPRLSLKIMRDSRSSKIHPPRHSPLPRPPACLLGDQGLSPLSTSSSSSSPYQERADRTSSSPHQTSHSCSHSTGAKKKISSSPQADNHSSVAPSAPSVASSSSSSLSPSQTSSCQDSTMRVSPSDPGRRVGSFFSSSLLCVLLLGLLIRVLLYACLRLTLPDSLLSLVSPPTSSFSSFREALTLESLSLSPYAGGVYRQQPLVFFFLKWLTGLDRDAEDESCSTQQCQGKYFFFLLFLDVVVALCLASIAFDGRQWGVHTLQKKTESDTSTKSHPKRETPSDYPSHKILPQQESREREEREKSPEKKSEESTEEHTAQSSVASPTLVAACYFLQPLTVSQFERELTAAAFLSFNTKSWAVEVTLDTCP